MFIFAAHDFEHSGSAFNCFGGINLHFVIIVERCFVGNIAAAHRIINQYISLRKIERVSNVFFICMKRYRRRVVKEVMFKLFRLGAHDGTRYAHKSGFFFQNAAEIFRVHSILYQIFGVIFDNLRLEPDVLYRVIGVGELVIYIDFGIFREGRRIDYDKRLIRENELMVMTVSTLFRRGG